MGREVRRVPLDFDWPTSKVWEGFLMPDRLREDPCPTCYEGSGYSREAEAVASTFYPHMIGNDRDRADRLAWHDKLGQAEVDHLVAEGRLRVFNRETREWESVPRTVAEVNAEQHTARGLDGHDAINRHILIRFRCERLGITVECPTCEGHGEVEAYPGQRNEAEKWERADPPEGQGWQLWETVSEGSPISPVFDTSEGLASWMASPAYRWGASTPMDYDTALRFVNVGWAPTMVAVGSDIRPGEEVVGRADQTQ